MLHVLALHDCIWIFSGLSVNTEHSEHLPVVLQPAQVVCCALGWQWGSGAFYLLQPHGLGWAGAAAANTGLCLRGLGSPVRRSRQGWKAEEGIPSLLSLQPQRGRRLAPQGEPAPRLSFAPGLQHQPIHLFIYCALFFYLLIYSDLNGSLLVLPIFGSWTCVILD